MSAELVHNMYIAYYQRPADPAGLAYWQEQLETVDGDWQAVAAAFAAAPESQDLYGDTDTAGLITAIYNSVFGRAPEAEGLTYWTDWAEENGVQNVAFAIVNGAQNEDLAVLNNKVAFAELFVAQVEAEGLEYTNPAAGRDLLLNIDAETEVTAESVAAAIAEADLDAEVPTGIAADLAALEAARADVADSQEALAETLEEAGILTDADLFNPQNLDDYELEAEAAILTAQTDLNTARQNDGTDAELSTALAEAQEAVDESTLRFNEDGEQLAQTEAGALVRVYYNEDDDEYSSVPDGNVFAGYLLGNDPAAAVAADGSNTSSLDLGNYSAKQLQNLATAAQTAYGADIAARGATVDLATQLQDDVTLYLNQEDDLAGDPLTALLGAISTYLDQIEAAGGDQTAIVAANGVFYTAVGVAATAVFDAEGESNLEDGARGDAVEALVGLLANRAELFGAISETRVAFTAAQEEVFESGTAELDIAQGAVDVRNGLIEDVQDAEADAAAIAELIAAYQAANADLAAAEEALGYAIEDLDETVEFGTEEADLFVLNLDALEDASIAAVQLLDLESGDAIFFGSDYQQGTSGDNNVLEFFIEAAGANTVITIETEAYGNNTDEVVTLTLLGVTSDELNFADGLLSIA